MHVMKCSVYSHRNGVVDECGCGAWWSVAVVVCVRCRRVCVCVGVLECERRWCACVRAGQANRVDHGHGVKRGARATTVTASEHGQCSRGVCGGGRAHVKFVRVK